MVAHSVGPVRRRRMIITVLLLCWASSVHASPYGAIVQRGLGGGLLQAARQDREGASVRLANEGRAGGPCRAGETTDEFLRGWTGWKSEMRANAGASLGRRPGWRIRELDRGEHSDRRSEIHLRVISARSARYDPSSHAGAGGACPWAMQQHHAVVCGWCTAWGVVCGYIFFY
jgi:hypothetical protein